MQSMVLSFRVSELQMLLGFAGRNKSGRKTELQARAVELLKLRSTPVTMKIKELYKSIQQSHASAAALALQQPSPAPGKDLPSVHSTNMQQQPQQQQQQPQQQQQRSNVYQPSGYIVQAPDRPLPPPRNSMYASMYHHNMYPPKASPPAAAPAASNFPVHPDVRLKKLPFFDLLGELLKPSSLVPQGSQRLQENNYVFHLTPQQATDVATYRDVRPNTKVDYVIQVQMRFCLLETSCEQDDFFPPGLSVKVNGRMCPLPNPIPTNKPGVEPKRPPKPVNITPMVKLSPTVPNTINVTWNSDFGRGYVIAVYLVRKLSSSELLQRLKARGIRHSDFTRGLIKEKLSEDADCEIATTSLRVSLVCPLGKMRMTTPCRASTCFHLQCFDASLYLQMNERKPTWMCPVCDKPALYDTLVIDGYFQQVLASPKLPIDSNEIQLHQDGSWSSLIVKNEQTRVLSPIPDVTSRSESEDLVVVSDKDPDEPTKSEKADKPEKAEVIDLTLSDSDDDTSSATKDKSSKDSSQQLMKTSDSSCVSSTVNSSSAPVGSFNAVSSSGYMSPSVITLDSPSPPDTRTSTPDPRLSGGQPTSTAANPVTPLRMAPPSFPSSLFIAGMPTMLELDSESSSPQPGVPTTMFSAPY
ncbi:E3 SUMO-protein ligase PIAS2 isoform X2 [Schistocerca gregaria]|uniref:E3 SUMO-protein ligase PIAS2 isoform X2 n=1 Tax=Schistocerca cancellata TaxID=274614 RepID=UPI0021189495|nr:E3 SUMO-protein ligase PIAS2 isoform X2 [Schistocerca cancellata]XP_049832983.1 E3 SUMO-protein ligase PIAS2 isoform X2 [Schistocerca gregaria]